MAIHTLPYRVFHRYFLSEKSPGSTLGDLNLDTSITSTIHRMRHHQWTRNDMAHYAFLGAVNLFVFCIFPASLVYKIPVLAFFALIFMVPVTGQFFFNALPILTWLSLYFTCSKIPNTWKPSISVQVLPALETIYYGDNLSAVLATINTSFFDVLAWLPYGIIHFSVPFIVAALIFLYAPPTALRGYAFAFGYMNLLGVLTQLFFPAAPPWYKNLHGLDPADYSMSGSPGGLGRIDELLGVDMYTTAFSTSPVIFGAFPSLHSGCAVMEVLFLSWLFPKFRFVWWGYACWLWWSTMYLTHHYFIDLIGGAALSLSVFLYTKYRHLPVVDQRRFCRWSYDQIQKHNIVAEDPLTSQYVSFGNTSDIEAHPRYEVEMSTFRSRPSRSNSPNTASLAPVAPPQFGHFEVSSDVSSLDQSASPSVFDDYQQQMSAATSVTSLEDLATDASRPKVR
ncbi:inositol phosphorylceramide synthase [Diutina catenulata]